METTTDNPMAGLWALVSYVVRMADGSESTPLGPDAIGYLHYGGDGVVAGIMMARGRPHFSTGNRLGASAEEKVRAWDSVVTYMGTYEFRGDTVVHRIRASVFPDWTGVDQLRHRQVLPNGQVVLSNTLVERGVQREAIATWRRIRPDEMVAG
ncbi:MAG: lipocalin-like domain-containing protein [Burkholderiales bacterium]|nr:lipocalin-like domain-containing protein [Burkholderiales bacterium]